MKNLTTNKLLIITLISILSLIFFHALFAGLNIEYRPYNGDFQTFNPLRRIFAGELPGRDFNPYLGLGVTYLNTVTTYLLGANFAASKFSTYFLSVTLHFIALITLFFLSGLKLNKAIIAGAFPLITIYLDRNQLIPIWFIIEPSNSNLSLRSFLPFLTVIVMFLLFKFCQKYPKLFYCLSGLLIGIQPFWSNDYGIPSFISLTGIIIFDLIKQKQDHKLLKLIYLFVAIFIGFSLTAYLLTGGYPHNWIRDNFGGVAKDQFWYFLWFNVDNKVFALSDILSHPFLYYYLITSILIFLYLVFREYQIKYLLLFYLAITVFGAGTLSSVGGTISFRYYLTTILVFLFIFPLVISFLLIAVSSFFRYNPHPPTPLSPGRGGINVLFNSEKYYNLFTQKKFNIFPNFNKQLLVLFLTIYYPTISLISIINAPTFFLNTSQNQEFFWVEELGGWLPNHWQKSIDIAKNIKQELQEIPPTERILSTYSSGMDVVAGAFNPTGIDYIIHVLGDEARNNYLKIFQETKPKYITTLREDITKWETWVRRTNWWFYREFFNSYEPVEATFYNIIWRRLGQPKNINNLPVICQILPENNHQVNLKITTENRKNDDKTYYIELALNYSLEVEPTGIPLIGKRGLVNAIETGLTKGIAQPNNRKYGLPPGHQNWYIPIEHKLNTPSSLEIQSYPENRSKLMIKSCQALLIAPVDDFAFTRQLTAENVNNVEWKNGISLNNYPGFIIDDEQIKAELYPGMEVEFASSGKRQIIDIKNNQILVNGSQLSPLGDGYPHPIFVKLK